MGHVLIIYSSRQHECTRSLAALFQADGYPIWWNRKLEALGRFELQIRETLGTASVVVAFWSPGATASYCERAELRVARRLGRLVNLRAPEFPVDEVPLHFRENQVLLLDLGYMGPILKTLRMVWEPDLSSGQETLLSGDKHMIDVCRGLHTAYQAAMDELTAVLGKARAVEIATGDTA